MGFLGLLVIGFVFAAVVGEIAELINENRAARTKVTKKIREDALEILERESIRKDDALDLLESEFERLACYRLRPPDDEAVYFYVDFQKMILDVKYDELEGGAYWSYVLTRRNDDWFVALYERSQRDGGPLGDLVYLVQNSQIVEGAVTAERCFDVEYTKELLATEIEEHPVKLAEIKNMLTLKYNNYLSERERHLRKAA